MKVVRISAVWCSGCLVMKKTWKELQEKYSNIEYIDYDYDMDEDEVTKYNVGDIVPINIFFKNDKEVYRLIGEKNKGELEEVIKKVMNDEI